MHIRKLIDNNKGLFSIEAAMIIPMIIAVIMLLIWLSIFFYNRSVLSEVASRAAICGSQNAELENTEIVDYVTDKVIELSDNKLIFLDSLSCEVTVEANQIKVNLTGSMSIPPFINLFNLYENNLFEISITESATRLKNSMFIRTVYRLSNLTNKD